MVDKTPARIRAMFDQISPRYDLLNHLLSLNSDVLWRRRAAAHLSDCPRVLDVCSGTGDMALELRRRWGTRVVGSDFSFGMIELARLKSRRTAGVGVLQADTLRLPFADRTFDGSVVAFGLRNVVDPARGVSEMARVVRPGGKVVVLEFTLPSNPVLRRGYLLYFGHVLPRIGRMIARSEIDAYKYLPDSVGRWPSPDELSAVLARAGLRDVSYELLFGGVAAIHVGRK